MKALLWGAGFGTAFFGLCLVVGSRVIFDKVDIDLEESWI